MTVQDLVCVLDVGKTNAKLSLVAADTGEVIWHLLRPAQAHETALIPCLDVKGIEDWVIESLATAPGRERIRFLVPITHGAAAALVDRQDNLIVVPDYEASAFESVAGRYRAVRDPYASTYSPYLPLGLNLGRQLFFLQTRHRETFERAARILLYPQYWAWRFCGVAASEVTSLGCHTDLWMPAEQRYSPMAERLGLTALLPPIHKASEVLANVSEHFCRESGLDAACRVVCGIHDSNASYLCHIDSRPVEMPLTVVSSGTWIVVMARGTDLGRLDESQGMLANVDADNKPVATARFMGGREYAAIAGVGGSRLYPDVHALERVVRQRAMALPAFTDEPKIPEDSLSDIERAALASLYCALRVDVLLDLLDARGDIVIDGPMTANPLFASIVATLRPRQAVLVSDNLIGSALAGSILAGHSTKPPTYRSAGPLDLDDLHDYRAIWRAGALTSST